AVAGGKMNGQQAAPVMPQGPAIPSPSDRATAVTPFDPLRAAAQQINEACAAAQQQGWSDASKAGVYKALADALNGARDQASIEYVVRRLSWSLVLYGMLAPAQVAADPRYAMLAAQLRRGLNLPAPTVQVLSPYQQWRAEAQRRMKASGAALDPRFAP